MSPVEFPEQNAVYARNQPEYLPLPVHRIKNPEGQIICCWKLSFFECLKLLFTRKIWHHVLTFNQPLQPQKLQIEYPFVCPKEPSH